MKTILASTLLIFTLLGHSAYAETQVDFLWSNASARVLESHSALTTTPTERPLNAVQWKWDRVEAQEAIRTVFPEGRQVIKPIQTSRSVNSGEAELSEVDLREELAESRHLLSDN